MKSKRITFLASPDFKQYLTAEAANDGISVGELIRKRCLPDTTSQEQELAALTIEVRHSIVEARDSLHEGLQAAAEAMACIKQEADRRTPRKAA
ncbi:MAG: hypothetical protein LBE78_11790 [Burkholderiaceae bacterium]|jgi:hypothetical protein|nr:hypothetical protein [Burkholderiaceae bacterium]